MSGHTSFRIGGPADALVFPESGQRLALLAREASEKGIPFTIIGAGANLLVSDSGIRGIVASTSFMTGISQEAGPGEAVIIKAGAGYPVRKLVDFCIDNSLAGMEFAAGLPGSVGGAVFMNARCYEREFADILKRVEWVSPCGKGPESGFLEIERENWSYKNTPFMPGATHGKTIIASAEFILHRGDREELRKKALGFEADRRQKGHFDYPCAGSMFKNNRAFGRPTGKILDELGFRGKRIGDAMVSPKHANIFVNAGRASASDMLRLVEEAKDAALKAYGFELEPEVIFLGPR